MEKLSEAFEKVKSTQADEKMRILVGMDVDDEELAPRDNSFTDEFNRNCTLSTKQRFYGFAICFVAGLTCTLLSILVFFRPIKFGFTFTLGNLLSLGSTAFLIGPKRQLTMTLDPVRRYATALFLVSMILALFCALYARNKLLTLLAIVLRVRCTYMVQLELYPFCKIYGYKDFHVLL